MLIANFRRTIQTRAAQDDRFKSLISGVAGWLHYDLTHLTRKVYWEDCHRRIMAIGPQNLDTLEISAGDRWRDIPFRKYRTLDYPEHDICAASLDPTLDEAFDLIIADQVFEHLLWPYRAARNVFRMLKPGGRFMIMTPFLIRVHEVPYDCSRWTETGMRHFLAECGFPLETTETASWGNASALKASLVSWGRVGWQKNLKNDPRFPITVWAVAHKPAEVTVTST
jgi:SAM-dependent methyltransferase